MSSIPEGKKRYQITLTEDSVKRFQALAARIGMPKSMMSSALDDALRTLVESMEKFEKKGKVTITDLFTAIGEHLDQINEEVKQDAADGGQEAPAEKRPAKKKPDMSKVYKRGH